MPRFSVRSTACLLSILVLLTTCSARSAFAAWPHDPNNGNLPICVLPGADINPKIVADGQGGAIIAWEDYRSGTSYDIYAQRVNAAGVALWTANGVAVCTAVNTQNTIHLISDGAGGAILVWEDFRSNTNTDLYAQRVNSSGVTQWTANGVVVCATTGEQRYAAITADGAGGAIVAWQDGRGSSNDIYAQRLNSAGVAQWIASGVAVCTNSGQQYTPDIAADGAGGAFIAWQDARGLDQDIYAQRLNAAGVPQWTADGAIVCNYTTDQYLPVMVSDSSGGAIVAWEDYRLGNSDIFAQRINAAGTSLWTYNGIALITAGSTDYFPHVISDGAGGAIVSADYYPYDVYAQRASAGGTALWNGGGLAVSSAALNQFHSQIASDGAGGAVLTWQDERNNSSEDVYAQRVSASGSVLWTYDGAAISNAVGEQSYPMIAADGAGGAFITWQDFRADANGDIYAQRIERYGYLGDPGPSIVSVKDVPFDQGGFVKVGWNASYLDVDPIAGIYEYRIWRSAPPNAATAHAVLARGVTEDAAEAAKTGRFLAVPGSATSYLWELVGRQPAYELPGYSIVTATTSDSVGAGNPRTAFMVEAGTSTYASSPHWFSAPDSGYSVDNLPPVIPAPFTAAYSAGTTHLHWGQNHDIDLAGYRLYRGTSSGFVPAPGNLISAQPDTGYGDVGGAGGWYKLSAIDSHGNESPYAILGPNGTLEAPGSSGVALYFAPPSPSPTAAGTMFRFGLPRDGDVTLTLFDQQGRRVRELTRGTLAAGEHRLSWDGRDEVGRMVPSGLYFAKLDHEGRTLVARVIEIH